MGHLLRQASPDEQYATAADTPKALASTGGRRGEIVNLIWADVDRDNSCIRLQGSKDGVSVRPV